MKSFESICKMTQNGVKEYMDAYLLSRGYQPIKADGFLYAKGTIPVLLVAHMDTVHKKHCTEITNKNGILSSPQGIGGDDRCGIFIIMNLVKELHCSVLLCEDEEIGGVGAKKFTNAEYEDVDKDGIVTKKKYIENLGVNYMIEFDRKGANDAVYYSCGNKDFQEFIECASSFKDAGGSFSDISILMPAAKLAGVNLSCGYYNAHTVTEYVVYEEMMDTVSEAKSIIKAECDKPFEYIRKQYNFDNSKPAWPVKSYPQYDYNKSQLSLFAPKAIDQKDMELELEVVWQSRYEEVEESDLIYGNTKAECWFKFFMMHDEVCMADVVDYSWT